MNEAKFTKGPLGIEGPATATTADPTCGGDYAICDASGLIIGEAWSLDGERPARENALLWAATPEMYEGLADICIVIGSHQRCEPTIHQAPWTPEQKKLQDDLASVVERTEAILAKARGEQ